MRIVIAGGGRVGGVLAARLVTERHAVTVIEKDRAVCDRIFEEIGAVVVCGDALDPRTLEKAGLSTAEVVAAVLSRDADNLAFSVLARSMSTARVMARLLDPSYRQAYFLSGVRDIIAEADVVVAKMTTAIEFPQLAGSLPLAQGDAILFEVPIKSHALVAGKTVAQVRAEPTFPRECVFIGLVDSEGHISLPDGSTVLRPGHTAILVARREQLAEAVHRLTAEPVGHELPKGMLDSIRAIDFLAPLSDDELEQVGRGIELVRKRAGERIFNKGEPGESFFVLLRGEVSLLGDAGAVVERVQPGGFFGEIALLTGQPRSTDAVADSDVELAAIGREDFQSVVMANPAIALEMSRILGQRLASASARKRKGFFGR